MSATPHLQKQLRELTSNPPAGFRVEADKSVFVWTVWFTGPQDTPYAGGQFKAQLSFTKEFPMEPPKFRILSSFWHPNVYTDGVVCISILHPPGTDAMNDQESAMMRWTPVQTIRSVLISVISLLSDPDPKEAGAPANVDALVQYRKDREGYNKKCVELAKKSLTELPPDFEPPCMEEKVDMVVLQQDKTQPQQYAFYDMDEEETFSFSPSPPPAAGAPKYSEELRQLRDMNVETDLNDEQLLELISECRGDVGTVLERLFS